MIIRYMHRGAERWTEAYTLIKIGKVTAILSGPDKHGITECAVEESLHDTATIGDYRVPEVGEYLYEGLRDTVWSYRGGLFSPDRLDVSSRLVQFSASEMDVS